MKKFVMLFALVLFAGLAVAQDNPVPASGAPATSEKLDLDAPYIEFAVASYDFKEIHQGEKVEYTFEFTNTGTQPLVLSNVQTTCGCTVPAWPREAIAPGAKEKIKVVFNSRGKMGRQNKVITIISNATNNPERIRLTGNVLPPKPAEGDTK